MTRTADVPARELVSQIPREAARAGVDPRPETLRSRAALLYEAIDDGLIACLEIKEPHRRSIALDTAITLCIDYAVALHQEPDRLTDAWPFPDLSRVPASFTSRAPALRCAEVCGFGMVPANPGTAPRYDRSRQNMGNSVPCYPRTKGSHSERVFGAFAVPSGFSPGPRGVWPTSSACRPRSATGILPDHGFRTTDPKGLSANQAVTNMVLRRRWRVVLVSVVRPRQSGNGYRSTCSVRRGVPRSPRCGPGTRTTYQQVGVILKTNFHLRTLG